MKITEILNTEDVNEIVKKLTSLKPDDYEKKLKALKNEWDVNTHRVMIDKIFLPDKEIKDAAGQVVGLKKVNRIAIPYQKMIVNRAVAFGFANDVQIEHNAGKDKPMNEVVNAIKRVLFENKETTVNRKIARNMYRSKEVAEIWYFQKVEDHERYGFKTSYKIKCMMVSPWTSDTLYPIFDDYGDMIAFARQTLTNVEGKTTPTVEVWTDTDYVRYVKAANSWEITQQDKSFINKIPVVYGTQDIAEWEDVKYDIERLELLFSKHAEINDYHASPKTFVKGEVKSMPQAGEANPILKGGDNSDIKILSWEHSPDSVKLEIETRLENIHKFTQTADISFKSIKAMNQISGVMLKMLFMDVHLKIMEKNEIWDEYFTRRYNVVKSMLSYLNKSFETPSTNLEMSPVIRPFMIDDVKDLVDTLMTANGNQPIISRKRAIELSGLSEDAEEELKVILKEEEDIANADASEPTGTDEIPSAA